MLLVAFQDNNQVYQRLHVVHLGSPNPEGETPTVPVESTTAEVDHRIDQNPKKQGRTRLPEYCRGCTNIHISLTVEAHHCRCARHDWARHRGACGRPQSAGMGVRAVAAGRIYLSKHIRPGENTSLISQASRRETTKRSTPSTSNALGFRWFTIYTQVSRTKRSVRIARKTM